MTVQTEARIRQAMGKKKRGGGVYVYRTRKPGSLIGYVLGRLGGVPWYAWPIATGIACAANHMLGSPWWIGLSLLLCTGRHFAYVGETTSFHARHRQHIGNEGTGDKWEKKAKPWADLDPKCVARLRLPKWKWLLRTVETMLIFLLAPVYNDKKNKANVRRVTLRMQARQRHARDRRRVKLSFNLTAGHVLAGIIILVLILIGR